MSEQQSRIGALLGNGLAFVTEKTALTRSQWLMLALFTTGAILAGLASTRRTHWSKTPSSSERSAFAAPATPTPSILAEAARPAPKPSAADVTAASLAAATGPAANTAGQKASEPTRTEPVPLASGRETEQADVKPTNSIEPSTRALFENLAKDIARINQKLDDLAGKQRQTSTRLAALIADGKQGRSRPADNANADRPEPPSRKAVVAVAPAAPKVTKASAPARALTVHPKRVVQRAKFVDLRRAVMEREFGARRRVEIAERNRRARRRRLASSLIFRPF